MILIITHKEDFTADYVIVKLNKRKIPFFRFNCEDILSYDIIFSQSLNINLSINGFSNFSSIWYRRTKTPALQTSSIPEKLYLLDELKAFLNNLFVLLNGKWLSPPDKILRAENKLLQLRLAQKCGLQTPVTIVSTNRAEIKRFLDQNLSVIIKPINRSRIQYSEKDAGLIFTNEIPADIVNQLDDYEITPIIFQKKLDKSYELRVTIVDDKVFAAKIKSQEIPGSEIDWRRGETFFEPYALPTNIADACRLLLRELELSFGAFDFVRTPEGHYVFLEVNPNGQWVWIEEQTGQPISEAIIDFLTDSN